MFGETSHPLSRDLFEYGIHTEDSDVRAHVSPDERCIFVFPTKNGVRAIEKNDARLVSGYQTGVARRTAEGWLVKPEWIEDLRAVKFYSWPGWEQFDSGLSTNEKGRLAVICVVQLMNMGRFPFWLDAAEDERENVQIKGTDIVVFCRKKVQVKCDYRKCRTGRSEYLFLQKAEINPLKRH